MECENREFTPGVIDLHINPTFLRSGLAGHILIHLNKPQWAARLGAPLTADDKAIIEIHNNAHVTFHKLVYYRDMARRAAKDHPIVDHTEELSRHDEVIGNAYQHTVDTNNDLPEKLQEQHELPG